MFRSFASTASTSRRSRSRVLALALLVALMLTAVPGSALAAPPHKDRYDVTYASAWSQDCIDIDDTLVCEYTSVYVYFENGVGRACLSIVTVTYLPDGYPDFIDDYGCVNVADDSFSMDKKLTAASLAPVSIEMISGADVEIAGTWIGFGNLTHYKNRYTLRNDKCTYSFSGKATDRNADATIMLDGDPVSMQWGVIATFESRTRISSFCFG